MIGKEKNILAAGCSFTAQPESWIDLAEDPNENIILRTIARPSYSNSRIAETILQTIVGLQELYDLVIIQWSAVGRAYAVNENDFIQQLAFSHDSEMVNMLLRPDDYILSEKDRYNINLWGVTDSTHVISNHLYKSSLTQMVMCKYALDQLKVNYVMYWGWAQINDDLYKSYKTYIDILYSKNFITYQGHGGMSEYAQDKLGKDKALIPKDFHPSREAHLIWYNEILKPLIWNPETFKGNRYEIT